MTGASGIMRKSGSFRTKSLLATGAAALLIAVPALAAPATAPAIFPAPQSLRLTGPQIALGDSVSIVAPKGTDASSLDLVRQVLTQAGVARVRVASSMGKGERGACRSCSARRTRRWSPRRFRRPAPACPITKKAMPSPARPTRVAR
ncbi:glycoside hydrolase family 20 zincin-like fold domain-containing protein [Novosphingobium sp. 9]|uniref:glycoside hydrolase family 20 zincin-like fold domain-containing protein n=1 Tax=Novosphingobium sp. 9 TaxID=2025349 RepID=UPI0021B5E48E|nr:glycoside hydrolase family 20 zincin-like fold domain-containing protein [Novosphingobium sp. 9]